jgi:hypothetical protein
MMMREREMLPRLSRSLHRSSTLQIASSRISNMFLSEWLTAIPGSQDAPAGARTSREMIVFPVT